MVEGFEEGLVGLDGGGFEGFDKPLDGCGGVEAGEEWFSNEALDAAVDGGVVEAD